MVGRGLGAGPREDTTLHTTPSKDARAEPDKGTEPASDPVGGMRPHPARRLPLFLVVAGLVALDLWSKQRVFAMLADPAVEKVRSGHLERILVFGEWLAFIRNLNYGAAFGQLTQVPYPLVILRCGAILVVSWLILRAPRGQRLYLAALVLILSGAAGNLYDNFFFWPPEHDPSRPFGPVRDFIDVYFARWNWHFATFNVADSCITVGAGLLILTGLLGGARERAGRAEEAPGPGTFTLGD